MSERLKAKGEKMGQQSRSVKGQSLPTILSEIRCLIETSRHHAAVTANLAMVNLYWNIGRIITQDIQKNEKRAEYGEQLIEEMGRVLAQEYGQGFSARNLWNMKRFYSEFQILQPLAAEFHTEQIRRPASKSENDQILQALPAESSDSILIDFSRHFHVGWTRYRILSGIEDKYG